jgi:hypothetical protein
MHLLLSSNLIVSLIGHSYLASLNENPAAAVVGGLCFLAVWSLLSLCIYHLFLVSAGQTTNEHLRGVYASNRGGKSPHCIGRAF